MFKFGPLAIPFSRDRTSTLSPVATAACALRGNDFALPPSTVRAANGSTIWTVPVCGAAFSSPALAADGTIYVGAGSISIPCPSNGTYFYAVRPNASIKWSFIIATIFPLCLSHFMPSQDATSCQSSPFIGADGTVYFGCSDSLFYALNQDAGQPDEGRRSLLSDDGNSVPNHPL